MGRNPVTDGMYFLLAELQILTKGLHQITCLWIKPTKSINRYVNK